jgi:hypothetical protein
MVAEVFPNFLDLPITKDLMDWPLVRECASEDAAGR